MIKQGMARVNVDILGISELKWTGMGDFNSDLSTMTCPSWVALQAWLGFTELDKAVILV